MTHLELIMYAGDIVAFARQKLAVDLDPTQASVLSTNPHRCILNCTRQWGKSTITAIKALHNAPF